MSSDIIFKLNEQIGELTLDEVRQQLSNNGFVHWPNAADSPHFRKFSLIQIWAQHATIGQYYALVASKTNITTMVFKLVGSGPYMEDEDNELIIAVLGFETEEE